MKLSKFYRYLALALLGSHLVTSPVVLAAEDNIMTNDSNESIVDNNTELEISHFILFGTNGMYEDKMYVGEPYISLENGLSRYNQQFHNLPLNKLNFKPKKLPNWLSFNSETEVFSGTPSINDLGRFTITFDVINPDTEKVISQGETTITVYPKDAGLPKLKNFYGYLNHLNININLKNEYTQYYNWKVEGLPEGIIFDPEQLTISGTAKELGTAIVSVTGKGKDLAISKGLAEFNPISKQFTITVVEAPLKNQLNNGEKQEKEHTEQLQPQKEVSTENNTNTTVNKAIEVTKPDNNKNSHAVTNQHNITKQSINNERNITQDSNKTNNEILSNTNTSSSKTIDIQKQNNNISQSNKDNTKHVQRLPKTGDQSDILILSGLSIILGTTLLKFKFPYKI